MKQQVVIIHGGNAFETYEEYLEDLKTTELTVERLLSKGWKANLAQELGDAFFVLAPKMPNAQNARFLEWKIWVEKLIPLLEEDVIFVGHSLGGIFLVKYLAENAYPKKIKATFLVAAPYNTPTRHSLVDFTIITHLDSFAKQAGEIYLYHSKDDMVVPFENVKRYGKDLPNAHVAVFEERGHFNEESFPELVEEVKKIT